MLHETQETLCYYPEFTTVPAQAVARFLHSYSYVSYKSGDEGVLAAAGDNAGDMRSISRKEN
jgi:hypothetical protein